MTPQRSNLWMLLYAAAFAQDFELTLQASRAEIQRTGTKEDPWTRIERYPGLYALGERAATIADLGVRALEKFDAEDAVSE